MVTRRAIRPCRVRCRFPPMRAPRPRTRSTRPASWSMHATCPATTDTECTAQWWSRRRPGNVDLRSTPTIWGNAMTATDTGLRYIDSDGHILEHPTAMPDYAPAQYRDRIWHVETDEAGEEWLLFQQHPTPRQHHARRRPRR